MAARSSCDWAARLLVTIVWVAGRMFDAAAVVVGVRVAVADLGSVLLLAF